MNDLDKFRPIIHSFFASSKTFYDFLEILKNHRNDIDINLLELLRFMTSDTNNSQKYPQKIKDLSRDIIIKILKKDLDKFEQLFNEFKALKNNYFEEQKDLAISNKIEKAVNYGEPLLNAKDTKNDIYWTRVLNDMNDDDYEEIIKNLVFIRDEMIKIINKYGVKSMYSISNIHEYIDLEFIRRNLHYKQYHFNGLFYFIYNFLLEYINPHLKQSLKNSLKEYLELLNDDGVDIENTNNETILEMVKYIMDNFFLYLEINDSIELIPN